ncbi:MAG: serine hydrolase [Oscillospiraceae bacterium]|nr:serine hydrolase [Oscillospiraceae bacterium]
MLTLHPQHEGVLSVCVMKGEVCLARTENAGEDFPQYSITKSLVSLGIGMLCAEGKLSLETTVGQLLPVPVSHPLFKVTLEALLTMQAGFTRELLFADRREASDYLAVCLDDPLTGSGFLYNNACAYLAGAMAEQAAGERFDLFLQKRILTPCGIGACGFEYTPDGGMFGASGLVLSTQDLAGLGIAVQEGVLWEDSWLHRALSCQVSTGTHRDYGYFFWTDAACSFMSGKWGQKCYLYPGGLVIAVNSEMKAADTVRTYVDGTLFPLLEEYYDI